MTAASSGAQFGRGAHLYVRRRGYTHHGVYVGNGEVIHFAGDGDGRKQAACIRRGTLDEFSGGAEIRVRRYGKRLDPREAIARAESKLGTANYHLFGNNCEHFASWCVADRAASEQVLGVVSTSTAGVTQGAAAAIGISTVAAAGEVAGLSGAGIMSGLAATGAGGAVGGLATIGAIPGLASVGIMQFALRDQVCFSNEERAARKAGRGASVAGAVAGGVGAVGAVSAAGSVAGLGAAGITSGLASVGAVVGGGMAAGVMVTAMAPAVGAAGLGYLTYRLIRAWREAALVEEPKAEPGRT